MLRRFHKWRINRLLKSIDINMRIFDLSTALMEENALMLSNIEKMADYRDRLRDLINEVEFLERLDKERRERGRNMFRIISDGSIFKVQERVWLFFWRTVQRAEDLDSKDFGGDKVFTTSEEATQYIKQNAPRKFKKI